MKEQNVKINVKSDALPEFADEYLDDNGCIIWNFYETEQTEKYKIYVFSAD